MALRGVLLCACICAASSSAGDFDCGDEPYLMLEEVLHNNLGGQGPHRGKEGIVYQAVEYYKNMHRIVHVNVHAVNKYVPWDVFANGLNGRFGVFTQEAGHSVDVEFSNSAWNVSTTNCGAMFPPNPSFFAPSEESKVEVN
ncbi:unnamed protein product, partial [Effrenium voratum]